MVFKVLQENLASSISLALKFVSPKAQLPILGNFLIEAKNGILKISATDLESSISLTIGAKIEEEGNITVSAKTFSEFVLTLPAGKIDVSNDGEDLVLKSGKFKARINTMPVSEYPKIQGAADGNKLLKLPSKALQEVADKLSFAVSTDVSRGGMTGVYFDNKDEKLKIVATDGFRLSLLEKTGFKEDFTLNVPAKIIDELGKIAAKEGDETDVYLNENKTQAIFKIQDAEISTRLIEGKYPPYEKIVPGDFETQATVDRQELLRSIKVAGIFSKDMSNVVKLKFSDGALKITASTANLGENESEIDCQSSGGDLEINFNYRYLIDILSRLSSKEIIFESAGPTKPGVLKEKDASGFLHLIMPVKSA